MMPFIEIVFCGLATCIFPFSRYRGGRTRPPLASVGAKRPPGRVGCRATTAGPCPSPAPHRQAVPPRDLLGTPGKGLPPCPAPAPPRFSQGPSGERRRAVGIIRFNFALSNFLGSFYWKLLQFSAWLEKMTAANPN